MVCCMVPISATSKLSCHRPTAAYSNVFQSLTCVISIPNGNLSSFHDKLNNRNESELGNGPKYW